MAKLFLLRHFKSQWNLENRFSGWTDMPISQDGKKDAAKKAEEVFKLLKIGPLRCSRFIWFSEYNIFFQNSISGTHIWVSKKHLQKYIDEFAFRYNQRRNGDFMFFELLTHLNKPYESIH